MTNIKRNYFYNMVSKVVTLIIPLLLTPYLARVLTPAGVGVHSYVYSIVTYFVLLGVFSFETYGQREIASLRNNKYEKSKSFFELFFSKLITCLLSIIALFILLISGVFGEYSCLIFISIINIIAAAADINFLYQGEENFKVLAIRNSLIKIIGSFLIIFLVKTPNDIGLYIIINGSVLLFANLSMFLGINRYISKVKLREINLKRHIKPCLLLFIPTISSSAFTILDKSLIGWLVPGTLETVQLNGEIIIQNISDLENGYYEQADKILKMCVSVFLSLSSIMMVKNSNAAASGELDLVKKSVKKSFNFVFFIGMPMMFGLIGIADNFSPWYFGTGYEKVPLLIKTISPVLLISSIYDVYGCNLLLPLRKDKQYTISIVIGSIANFIFSFFLIYFYKSLGAVIGTIMGQIVLAFMVGFFSRKYISFFEILKDNWKYIISSNIMFSIVFFVSCHLYASIGNTIILIAIGVLTYFIMLVILRDKLMRKFLSVILKKEEEK